MSRRLRTNAPMRPQMAIPYSGRLTRPRDRSISLAIPWPVVAMAAVVAVSVGQQAWWLATYRSGHPFDIDEAAYLTTALEQLNALHQHGISGAWQVFMTHGIAAPLVPALWTVVFAVAGSPNLMLAFAVNLAALALTIAATYDITRRLAGAVPALVAVIALAGAPALIDAVRTLQFAMVATAFYTVALMALVRSDHLRRTGWTLLWGACIGLMVLTRTMTIAFVPGLALAALMLASGSRSRPRAAINLAAAVTAGVLLAATWVVANWRDVSAYLVGVGYGSQRQQHGLAPSGFSLQTLGVFGHTLVEGYLYWPHTLLLAVGAGVFITLVALSWQRLAGRPWPWRLLTIASLPQVAIAVAVLEAFAALVSSTNLGTYFLTPLMPGAIAAVIVAFANFPGPKVLRRVALVLAVVVGLVGLVGKSGIGPFVGGTVVVPVPGYGDATLWRPAAPITIFEIGGGYGQDQLEPPASDTRWLTLEARLARFMDTYAAQHHQQGVYAYGFGDRFFNPNTIDLEAMVATGRRLPAVWLPPAAVPQGAPDIASWLTAGDARYANLLLTADRAQSELPPVVDPAGEDQGASAAGFSKIKEIVLPNGRHVTIWWRARPS